MSGHLQGMDAWLGTNSFLKCEHPPPCGTTGDVVCVYKISLLGSAQRAVYAVLASSMHGRLQKSPEGVRQRESCSQSQQVAVATPTSSHKVLCQQCRKDPSIVEFLRIDMFLIFV